MAASLTGIRISGLTSIDDLTLELRTPVTVLIGANGSGKSNIVSALELLGRISDRQLQRHVLLWGGFSQMLHKSAQVGREVQQLQVELLGNAEALGSIGYQVMLGPAPEDGATLYETIFQDSPDADRRKASLGNARESRLRAVSEYAVSGQGGGWESELARQLLSLLSGCRVFHFQDTSFDAPVKQRSGLADNLTLRPDAKNLASVLIRLRSEHPITYRRILRAVRVVAPFFEDFVLEPEPQSGTVLLRWREKGLDTVFSADALSDGTLRFICLAVLFLQPDRPPTIVLDEPELGLHPLAIHQLAGLIKETGSERQKVVLATQSVTLLSQFEVAELVVIERSASGTTAVRPDLEELGAWLEKYSLGELWEMNLLGGRPRPDPLVNR